MGRGRAITKVPNPGIDIAQGEIDELESEEIIRIRLLEEEETLAGRSANTTAIRSAF